MTAPAGLAERFPLDPGATLVVTRPAADAATLIDALQARGRRVVALPVLGIRAVGDATVLERTMAALDDYAVAIFVSPNAIRHALAHRSAPWPAGVVVAVMGPGSVATLREMGIAPPIHRVVSPGSADREALPAGSPIPSGRVDAASRFDSEALFDALDATIGLTRDFDGRVLILRGNGGRAWLATRLRALGIAVDEVEAYRRELPVLEDATAAALGELARAAASTVFVVTSSEGVDNLVVLVEAALHRSGVPASAARAWLFGSVVLAPHQRIAERATGAGFGRVALCAPSDRGILAALE